MIQSHGGRLSFRCVPLSLGDMRLHLKVLICACDLRSPTSASAHSSYSHHHIRGGRTDPRTCLAHSSPSLTHFIDPLNSPSADTRRVEHRVSVCVCVCVSHLPPSVTHRWTGEVTLDCNQPHTQLPSARMAPSPIVALRCGNGTIVSVDAQGLIEVPACPQSTHQPTERSNRLHVSVRRWPTSPSWTRQTIWTRCSSWSMQGS